MVICVKMAELIEMLFGLWARIICCTGSISSVGRGIFGGKGRPIVKYRDFLL